jgi:light-regulated signal transduction histidine kinase (bacteriophytochrome)
LRAVKSYTQLLARRYQPRLDGEAARYIDRAVDAVSRMQRLIDDLLSYSRVGTVGHPFVATECDDVVREVLDDLQPAIHESGASISCDRLPTLPADRSQLRQLLQNVIGNAIKFRGNKPPRIHVTAQAAGSGWHFTIRDNGIGIEAEYAQRVFVIFQRLHSRRQYPGTGVGLAVCKRIVERHGGRIWIEPASDGGTCVHFVLPGQHHEQRRAAVGG